VTLNTTHLGWALAALDYASPADLTNESLIALMSCDWEGEGLSLYAMGLIQEEFNARNLATD